LGRQVFGWQRAAGRSSLRIGALRVETSADRHASEVDPPERHVELQAAPSKLDQSDPSQSTMAETDAMDLPADKRSDRKGQSAVEDPARLRLFLGLLGLAGMVHAQQQKPQLAAQFARAVAAVAAPPARHGVVVVRAGVCHQIADVIQAMKSKQAADQGNGQKGNHCGGAVRASQHRRQGPSPARRPTFIV